MLCLNAHVQDGDILCVCVCVSRASQETKETKELLHTHVLHQKAKRCFSSRKASPEVETFNLCRVEKD